jgi:hypothetical protein
MNIFWGRGHLARISGEIVKNAGGTPALQRNEMMSGKC